MDIQEAIKRRNQDSRRQTTVITISYVNSEERPLPVSKVAPEQVLSYLLNIAVDIAGFSKMDILSVAHVPGNEIGTGAAVIVYLNNGLSLDSILVAIKPIESTPYGWWKVFDIYKEFGAIQVMIEGKKTLER